MVYFNLSNYERFNEEFRKEFKNRSLLPGHPGAAKQAEKIFKETFGITVKIDPTNTFGTVAMEEEDFTMFVLRWK